MKAKLTLATGALYLLMGKFAGVNAQAKDALKGNAKDTIQINQETIGFQIPNFAEFLSFMIKFLFIIAGLMALFYMLWGALGWVTSGGDKDAVGKARDKIQAAVVGILVIVFTLSIIIALEQVVFKEAICFGISCPIKISPLLKKCGVDGVKCDVGSGDNSVLKQVDPNQNAQPAKTADKDSNSGQALLPATGL